MKARIPSEVANRTRPFKAKNTSAQSAEKKGSIGSWVRESADNAIRLPKPTAPKSPAASKLTYPVTRHISEYVSKAPKLTPRLLAPSVSWFDVLWAGGARSASSGCVTSNGVLRGLGLGAAGKEKLC